MFKWFKNPLNTALTIVMGATLLIGYAAFDNVSKKEDVNLDDYVVKIDVPGGHGSGVIVNAPNGETYILTAAHVAEHVAPISYASNKSHTDPTIYRADGTKIVGYVTWISSVDDVALIRVYDHVDGATINCDYVPVGTYMEIVGAPAPGGYIMPWMHTWATVGGYYLNPFNEHSDYMFFDGSIYGGNSGGPMFNSDNEVVGLVIGMFADFGGFGNLVPMGFNVAVPSEVICEHLGW